MGTESEGSVSYCDVCGLSSCYERGGYCPLSSLRLTTVLDELRHAIAVKVQWQSGDWKHVTLGHQYNYPQQGEWIEVIW